MGCRAMQSDAQRAYKQQNNKDKVTGYRIHLGEIVEGDGKTTVEACKWNCLSVELYKSELF